MSQKGKKFKVGLIRVLTCEDHPDSDHLHVTTVDVGDGTPLQIVCGAPNCRKGLMVLCATIGSVLYPDGGDEEFKIKRSKIRGVESLGMLCAEDELGIGASHDGIVELPADAPGQRIGIGLIADQNPPLRPNSHWFRFLNQDTVFFDGIEKMALKFHMPVYFCRQRRLRRGFYELEFVKLYDGEERVEPNEITGRYVRQLEQDIMADPGMWLWSHRRWKHHRTECQS